MPKRYEIGQSVGGVTIVSKVDDEKYNKYLVKCNKCGTEFIEYSTRIAKHKNGCVQCKYKQKAIHPNTLATIPSKANNISKAIIIYSKLPIIKLFLL